VTTRKLGSVLLLILWSISIWAQQTTNTVKINGTTTATGNGTTDAGTQRVTISSDSTGKVAVTNATTSNLATSTDLETVRNAPIATAATGIIKVGLTDGTGNAITSTAGALNVTATLSPSASQIVTTALNNSSGTVAVTGSASDGTTATFSPVLGGGMDGTGKVQTFLTSPSGALVIDSTGTAIPVSFSAAASQIVTTALNNSSGTVAVTGSASDGTTATFSPVQGGGVDVNGKIQSFLVTTGGALVVDSSATNTTVTGTVTATQGTGTNLHVVTDATSTTTVTQATGTNLHAVLDATSTTAVTQATGTNLHAVTDSTSLTNTVLGLGSGTLAVVGSASDGTTATFSPVQGGGVDANGKIQSFLVTTGGALVVDSSATATTVTGTVTVAQATTASLHAAVSVEGLGTPGTAIATGNGTVNTGTQRVTLASDSTGQVTGSGTAGTAAAGVLTVQFADSANPFQTMYCPTNAFRIEGTTSVTGTTSSNIVWLRNNGTTTTFTSPPGSGLRFYIYSAQLVNSGATNVTVNLSADGAAGVPPTTLATWVAPTNTTPFGGSNMQFPSGMFTPTTGRALSIVASGSSTTVYANIQGCLGP